MLIIRFVVKISCEFLSSTLLQKSLSAWMHETSRKYSHGDEKQGDMKSLKYVSKATGDVNDAFGLGILYQERACCFSQKAVTVVLTC